MYFGELLSTCANISTHIFPLAQIEPSFGSILARYCPVLGSWFDEDKTALLNPPHGDILPLSKVPFLIIFPATSVTCSSAVIPPDPVSVSVPVSIVFVLKVLTGEKLLFNPSDVLIRQKYVIPFSKLTSSLNP